MRVVVYNQVDDQWVQKGQLLTGELNNGVTGDFFGQSLTLSDDGSILAVGAPQTNVPQYNEGRARVYVFNETQWTQVGASINGEQSNDYFGYDVSLSADGNFLAVAAPFATNSPYPESGVVKVYSLSEILQSDDFAQANFAIYPNPTRKIINISLNDGSSLTQANIYNSLGQLVQTGKSPAVDISGLPTGTYIIEAITSRGKSAKTFIKE